MPVCAAKENRIITWIPFGSAVYCICPVWLIARRNHISFPYVLGAFVGMIAGILVGTLVEFILKMLFAPAYGSITFETIH